MKKYLYISSAFLLSLASCASDITGEPDMPQEEAEVNKIRFTTNVEATRGYTTGNGTLTSMFVTATFAKDDDPTDENPSLYYSDVEYARKNGVYNSVNGTYYWPGFMPLNFYAYYPSKSDLGARDLSDLKLVEITPNTKISKQVDFVTAKGSGSNTNAAVQLDFSHHLAWLEIKAKNGNAAYTFNIKGFVLANFKSQANYDMRYTDVEGKSGWELLSSTDNYMMTYESAIRMDGSKPDEEYNLMNLNNPSNNDKHALLIPQTLNPWVPKDRNTDKSRAYIGVLLQIVSNDGNHQVYPTEEHKYGWAAIPVDFTLEEGRKHVITLDFSKGAGVVGPGLGIDPNGDNDGLSESEIDKKVSDDHIGEDILGKQAAVEASVSEWNKTSIPIGIDMKETK